MRRFAKRVFRFVIVCVLTAIILHLLKKNPEVIDEKFEKEILGDTEKYENQARLIDRAEKIPVEVNLKSNLLEKDNQDKVYPFYVGPDNLGNYEEAYTSDRRKGPGEYGQPVVLDKSLDGAVKDSIGEFGFNIVASDKVSLDRMPDDLRKQECKHFDYPKADNMPSVAVILVFHNEAWSTLMRTVHSVYNMSPPNLLKEIVMINDASNKDHLTNDLPKYIQGRFANKVVLHVNDKREGLIRARSIGARVATADILVYLDAHCEAEPNWLMPLITPIINDPKTCTCPLVDVVDGNKYSFTEQAGGDEDGYARGAWDWDLLWKRVPLTHREKAKRKFNTEPYRSPAMAGGLFAINREWFFKLGLYDDELEIWGGENFEISYKLWMCGGSLLFVPCSRVGHIYRLPGWHGNPAPQAVHANFAMRNYRRVVDVWWDDYQKYFLERRPEARNVDPGDLTIPRKIRTDLQCKNFEWFMTEIAYDIPKRYPLVVPDNGAEGHLSLMSEDNICIDIAHAGQGVPITLRSCGTGDTNVMLTWQEDVRPGSSKANINSRKLCFDGTGMHRDITMWECHGQGGNQLWKYNNSEHKLIHASTGACVTADLERKKVTIEVCTEEKRRFQEWKWERVYEEQLAVFNKEKKVAVLVEEINSL